ncbi:MAG: hypothetical protein Unbinned627contig1001_23 [Prokaryotic dsDNA virus sp.]|jgi:hypothetical protein|nr:MAG: hypothetical protein Unbinned627contig1001_23 [Prokaryotic dsDNA virus sp.]|tara:strand:- start:233 stop:958 length:726 start_codon:yes stop_codon:yes gene_type:complete
MMNEKIQADLEERGKASLSVDRKILGYLEAEPNQVHTLRTICNAKNGAHNGTFWTAAYSLAARGKIGYADRKYHVFGGDLASLTKKVRCVVWHRDHVPQGYSIRPQWAAYQASTTQPSLFGDNITSLNSEELDRLIERAQEVRFERLLEGRYRGAVDHMVEPIKKILKKAGVADPVALVHGDDTCTFLTLTATNAMPLQVTYATKAGNEIAQTQELSHITIHGAPAVWTIFEAYKRARGDQ